MQKSLIKLFYMILTFDSEVFFTFLVALAHGVASPPGIARLGHTAVTVVYARAIFNLSSGKVGPLVALLLRVGNLII